MRGLETTPGLFHQPEEPTWVLRPSGKAGRGNLKRVTELRALTRLRRLEIDQATAPSPEAVQAAYQLLVALGERVTERSLDELARALQGELPVPPKVVR